MLVSELIEYLQKQPQDLQVVYRCSSEQDILESEYIHIKELCTPRPDGWVQNYREDKPSQTYLVLPGQN